jgi:hypothetical protein
VAALSSKLAAAVFFQEISATEISAKRDHLFVVTHFAQIFAALHSVAVH